MFASSDDPTLSVVPADSWPEELPILPLRSTVAFPFIIMPLSFDTPCSINLVRTAIKDNSLVGLAISKQPEVEELRPEMLYETGVVVRVHGVVRDEKDTLWVMVQGIERFKIERWVQTEPFLMAKIKLSPDITEEDKALKIEALLCCILELSHTIVKYLPQVSNEVNQFLDQVDNPRLLIYIVASNIHVDFEDQLKILLEDLLSVPSSNLCKNVSTNLCENRASREYG